MIRSKQAFHIPINQRTGAFHYRIALVLLLVVLVMPLTLYADPPYGTNASVNRAWAKIGDTLSFNVQYSSDLNNPQASLDLSSIGGGVVTMGTIKIGMASYSASCNYTVVAGTANDILFTPVFLLGNASGTIAYSSSTVSISIDNEPPARDGMMYATVDGALYDGKTVTASNSIHFYQNLLRNPDKLTNTILDLSTLGLSSNNPMATDPQPLSGGPYYMPLNKDGAYILPITIVRVHGCGV